MPGHVCRHESMHVRKDHAEPDGMLSQTEACAQPALMLLIMQLMATLVRAIIASTVVLIGVQECSKLISV